MEIHERRHITRTHQDQENIYAGKKIVVTIPNKRQGLSVRGALGELNSNVQPQRELNTGKASVASVELEKKVSNNRVTGRSNYHHVQSKVDTGMVIKPIVQPSSRPPLRREESTRGLAVRAAARAVIKDAGNKQNDMKKSNAVIQAKNVTQDSKKVIKVPILKETKEKRTLKPILKESTESLGKLKLADSIKNEKHEKKCVTRPKLPEDIEDIDAGDDSPLLMSIYIKNIYKYLTELEKKYPIKDDHLRKQTVITGQMRATLMDWLVEVQKQFSLSLETFQLTVGIIDRYLQVTNIQRKQLQLVGVSAMFIASKYEEIYAPDITDFIYVTANAYSKSEVFQCEREIMSKLEFCLARPIPLSFLRRFIKAAHGTSKNHHLAKYLVDLCLIEYSMSHYNPSELAAAAMCLSLYLLSNKKLPDVWTSTMSYYSGYTLEHIEPIIRKIAKIVINVDNSKYKAVYNKYLDVTLAKVASLPQLKAERIQKLAGISQSTI